MPFSDIIGHMGPKTKLRKILAGDRMAHAYLFFGDESIGKRQLALRFTQALVCESSEAVAKQDCCGTCRGCRQIMDGLHPDFLFIAPDPEKANPQITIDRIRDLEHHTLYRPLYGVKKICLIDDADRLTLGAANALLKTLEEPPAYSVFFLITSKPSALPATIRSRCLALRFPTPSQTDIEGALALKRALPEEDARFLTLMTDGKIGQALDADLEEARATREEYFALLSGSTLHSFSHAVETAERLSKSGRISEALDWLTHGVRDLLLVALHIDAPRILNESNLPDLKELVRQTSPESLLTLVEALQELERDRSRNLNLQLGLENFFLKLRQTIPA